MNSCLIAQIFPVPVLWILFIFNGTRLIAIIFIRSGYHYRKRIRYETTAANCLVLLNLYTYI